MYFHRLNVQDKEVKSLLVCEDLGFRASCRLHNAQLEFGKLLYKMRLDKMNRRRVEDEDTLLYNK